MQVEPSAEKASPANARLSVLDELNRTGRSKLRAVTPDTNTRVTTQPSPPSEVSFADELVRRLASRREHIATQAMMSA